MTTSSGCSLFSRADLQWMLLHESVCSSWLRPFTTANICITSTQPSDSVTDKWHFRLYALLPTPCSVFITADHITLFKPPKIQHVLLCGPCTGVSKDQHIPVWEEAGLVTALANTGISLMRLEAMWDHCCSSVFFLCSYFYFHWLSLQTRAVVLVNTNAFQYSPQKL